VIRAWRGNQSWEQAKNNPKAFIGQSVIFQNPTATELGAGAGNFASFGNAPSFTIVPVPEPEVIALGVLGAIMLYLFKQWKSIKLCR
jgi:hypothetical protein